MWPWGHLTFAYLLYSPPSRLRPRISPTWPGVALLVVGSQGPDLGDSIRPALDGRFHDLAFLLWPLVSQTPPGEPKAGILPSLLDARLEGSVVVDLGLAVAALSLWLLEGAPGARGFWDAIRGRIVR